MGAPDINKRIMRHFTDLTGDRQLTILLGAGASVPSGLPSWNDFSMSLALESGLVSTPAAATTLLRSQDPAIVLEAAQARAGEGWSRLLSKALYGDSPEHLTPSPLHLAAAEHYLEAPTSTTLATLNFDILLEQALINEGSGSVLLDAQGQRVNAKPTVHHLHGAIHNGRSISAVVTYKDYAELVAAQSPWQLQFLRDALNQGPLLLAGTSYRDPDIRHWLHVIMRDSRPKHPVLVTIVRESLELDRKSFSSIDSALRAEWESINLTVLTMHDYTDVAIILRELRHASNPGYKTPQERTREIWRAHKAQFEALQVEYSDLLEEESFYVAQALSAKSLRATLWLSSGDGQLARWASEGTVYASADYLKFVPTGHDSPWIAGEALASEEVKLKDVQDRKPGVTPTWRSVLAVPVSTGDDIHPNVTSAVLTFGLSQSAGKLLEAQRDWYPLINAMTARWSRRISAAAFSYKSS